MREKLSSEAGLTLVEMLAASVILILLGLMLNAGLQMTIRSYQTIIARSEVELLLSTAVNTLADDLRYAWNVKVDEDDDTLFTYTSDSYGEDTRLILDGETEQIMAANAQSQRVLSTGDYGSEGADGKRAYKVKELEISAKPSDNTFNIKLTVEATDAGIRASTPEGGVTIRCLNPMNDTTGGGS